MKQLSIFITISCVLFLFACKKTKQENNSTTFIDLASLSNPSLTKWSNHYRAIDSTFSMSKFYNSSKSNIEEIPGNIYGVFDEEFDKIYYPFLVFNSDSTQYIDFDSYGWTVDETGAPSGSPDQEIDLVDIQDETVTRVAFRGPSQFVEEAFWQNDSTVILLEYAVEDKPYISVLHLQSGKIDHYSYKNSLVGKSNYFHTRFTEKNKQ